MQCIFFAIDGINATLDTLTACCMLHLHGTSVSERAFVFSKKHQSDLEMSHA